MSKAFSENRLSPIAATLENLDAVRERVSANPLMAAPAASRAAVWRLWTCHQHLFASALPIAGAVGVWVRDHDLREEDAVEILTRAMSPFRMSDFRFASDLMTWLAGEARQAIERRRNQAEIEARRVGPSTPEARAEVKRLSDHFGGEFGGN